jgi:S1-C subfamily serine protease
MNVRFWLAAIVLVVAVVAMQPELAFGRETSIASSVVQVFVYADAPDLALPWQTMGTEPFGGSGVIIEGHRILTNAHVVEDAVGIEVKRADGSETFVARVTFISHDADLALLSVEDGRVFRGGRPMAIGQMPKLLQEVEVWGFPEGGATLSITSGIVSRIEVGSYAQSGQRLLSAQIDAAINSGNSGGPVISRGAVVGIAMQTLEGAENVGYMIPAPVVRHFLEDVSDGRYDGFPQLGIRVQDMESAAQRLAAGMGPGQTGALVLRIDYGGPAYGVLRPRDVLLEVEGYAIANDLTVAWPGIGRVHYTMIPQSHQIGDHIHVRILRGGKQMDQSIELTPFRPLVPGRRATTRPRYLVFGGLVFQPLSRDYLEYFDEPPPNLLSIPWNEDVTEQRREVILMQRVLPHPVNRGYQNWEDEVVELVNGLAPRDMRHLAQIIDQAEGRWLRVRMQDGHLITLDLQAARRAHEQILDTYGIAEERYLGDDEKKPRARRRRCR